MDLDRKLDLHLRSDSESNRNYKQLHPNKSFNVAGLVWLLFSFGMIGFALAFNERSWPIILLCSMGLISEILRNAELTLDEWPELGDGWLLAVGLTPLMVLGGGGSSDFVFYANRAEKTAARVLFGMSILIIESFLLFDAFSSSFQLYLTLYLIPFTHLIPRAFSKIIMNTLWKESGS